MSKTKAPRKTSAAPSKLQTLRAPATVDVLTQCDLFISSLESGTWKGADMQAIRDRIDEMLASYEENAEETAELIRDQSREIADLRARKGDDGTMKGLARGLFDAAEAAQHKLAQVGTLALSIKELCKGNVDIARVKDLADVLHYFGDCWADKTLDALDDARPALYPSSIGGAA